jgi:transcriptional regulator with XRE-family HTH domain
VEYGLELGRWVKERRTALGLTQAQLAERMSYDFEVDTNWVSGLEAGRRKSLPDFKYLEALASALRVLVTDVQRGAGVLPVDVEQPMAHAPGSATLHALVDQIDWVSDPNRRLPVESMLRAFRDQDMERASRQTGSPAGAGHGQR